MSAPLPHWRLAAFAALSLPLSAASLPLALLLVPLYVGELGASAAAVGLAVLAGRVVDVVTDPLVGIWSDRARGRWGRRLPFVIAGAPLGMVALWMLFAPPPDAGAWRVLVWGTALHVAWTLMSVPHAAWAAELSGDYHERTRITAWREGMQAAGALLALALPALLLGVGAGAGESGRVVALAAIIALPLALLPLTLGAAPLGPPAPPPTRARAPRPWSALRLGPVRRLLWAQLLNATANALAAALFLTYVATVLRAEAEAGLFLVAYLAAAVAGAPFWLWVSRRIGKHRAWAAAGVWACLAFAAAPFLGAGDVAPFLLVCIATGIALGGDQVLAPALLADAADLDQARGGAARAGLLFAAWSMTGKLALGLGAALAAFGLAAAGHPGAPDAPADLVLIAILYGAAPLPLKLAAAWLIRGHRLTRDRHARIRRLAEIRAARTREQGSKMVEP